jgi:hypothetical protein
MLRTTEGARGANGHQMIRPPEMVGTWWRMRGAPENEELETGGGARAAFNRWVQRALNTVAHTGLGEDGVLGARSRAAIRAFQRAHGLPADGKVGARTRAALIQAGAPPMAGMAAPDGAASAPAPTSPGTATATAATATAGGAGAPRLDRDVAGVTIFQPIPLGVGGVPNETAIYCPPGLRRAPTVDVVVYLHGFETNLGGQVICGRAPDIGTYLRDRTFALREPVRDSRKNVVLVAPKLGPHSEAGSLVRPQGFTRFMGSVLAALPAAGGWQQPPRLGRLILAGHSGGGAVVARIAAVNHELVGNLKEVWMFDALYGNVESWRAFLTANPGVVARFVFTPGGGTAANHRLLAQSLRGRAADIRQSRTTNHCLVPREELRRFLDQSALDGGGVTGDAPAPTPTTAPTPTPTAPAGTAPAAPTKVKTKDPGVVSAMRRWNMLTGVPDAPLFHQLVDRHRPPHLPLPLLIAFSSLEASGFLDATHGTHANGWTRPDFYELGVFQVPAGLHGTCTSDKFDSCALGPPGQDPHRKSAWFRIADALGIKADLWKDPTAQVRIGLQNLEDDAATVRKRFPTLFPNKGSDWDLRAAVLMPFGPGIGYTLKLLTRHRARLEALPEPARWPFLRAQGATTANVDAKMTRATNLAAALGTPQAMPPTGAAVA